MLSLYFHNLLPTEYLLRMAKDGYTQLRKVHAARGHFACHVTVSEHTQSAEPSFRVSIALLRAGEEIIRVQTEGEAPCTALRYGLLSMGVRAAGDAQPLAPRYALAS